MICAKTAGFHRKKWILPYFSPIGRGAEQIQAPDVKHLALTGGDEVGGGHPAAAVSAPLELTRQSRFQSEEDGSAKLVKPGQWRPLCLRFCPGTPLIRPKPVANAWSIPVRSPVPNFPSQPVCTGTWVITTRAHPRLLKTQPPTWATQVSCSCPKP